MTQFGKGVFIKKYIILFAVFIALSVSILVFFACKVAENRDRYEAHLIMEKSLNEVENEKELLRNYAQIIAKNPEIIKAILEKDRNRALKAVVEIANVSKKSPLLNGLWFQIHTDKMQVLVRSWNLRSHGMNLDGFRKGVMFAREHQVATVAIEAGRKLNIKAIAPIYSNNRLIGFSEVIGGYQNIINNLKKDDIDFAVYMDRSLLKTAIDMQDFDAVGEYIFASEKTIYKPFNQLDMKDLDLLRKNRFLKKNDRIFTSMEISDYDGRVVGMIVSSNKEVNGFMKVIFTKSKIEIIDKSISKKETINYYENMDIKELVRIRSDVSQDERMLYNQAVRKKINNEAILNSLLLKESKTNRLVKIE